MNKIISNIFFTVGLGGIIYLAGGLVAEAYNGDGSFSNTDIFTISHPFLVLIAVSLLIGVANVLNRMGVAPTLAVKAENTEGVLDVVKLDQRLNFMQSDIDALKEGEQNRVATEIKTNEILWHLIDYLPTLPDATQENLDLQLLLPKATQDKKRKKAMNLKTGSSEFVA